MLFKAKSDTKESAGGAGGDKDERNTENLIRCTYLAQGEEGKTAPKFAVRTGNGGGGTIQFDMFKFPLI